ncbi:MAG TPA: histone deacetylase [Bryobacteraceae bacterium]|nr:histone deacetylase [Bryobacteraceae bacterium]
MALPFKLVYHDGYDLNLGAHVFPSQKFRLIKERLVAEGFAEDSDFVAPERATDHDLTLVHSEDWVTRLRSGRLRFEEVLQLEIPYSQEMVNAFWLAAGGSILAARGALRDRLGYNIGGGFHHAFRGHGEGFCAIHDVAVAIRRLQADKLIGRAMVIDCDVHHGNGTAGIFAGDATVFTLSIHQYNNYPSVKPPSNLDIHLEDGVEDEEYLQRLQDGLTYAMNSFRPDLVAYVAGSDPYYDDQLGGLALTLEGLKQRDSLVLSAALQHQTPAFVTLAGGYARKLDDTVTIHSNTAKVAAALLT